MISRRDEKKIRAGFRMSETDIGMLDFCCKMLRKSKSEVLRKAIQMLRQDIITGRYDDEIG